MLETIIANTTHYIEASPWLALGAVFLGGALTASNPCVLAMVPLTISFVAGRRDTNAPVLRAFGFSLIFVLGLAITFTSLGMIAALAGTLYGEVSPAWNWVVALVCILMGLHLMEMFTLPIPSFGGATEAVRKYAQGPGGALILGMLFGVVSAPCAAPLLVILLTYLAGSNSSVLWGGTLLLSYSLGHSLLILMAGTSMGLAKLIIDNPRTRRTLELLRRSAGLVIVVVGFYFASRSYL